MTDVITNAKLDEVSLIVTDDIVEDACSIIDSSRKYAYSQVNIALILRNWLLGKRISDEAFKGEDRAEYGLKVIKNLADKLKEKYGKGFSRTDLYYDLQVFQTFPDLFYLEKKKIVPKSSGQSQNEKVPTVSGQLVYPQKILIKTAGDTYLTYSHYRRLVGVDDAKARNWYLEEAKREGWSYRTLDRNISTQYYYRLLSSQNKSIVENEMKEKTASFQNDKFEFIKNPIVAEFLGLEPNIAFNESALESAIITNIQKFIMEMGKGYAFVARQQHIHTEKEDYFIDLVFYNYILKCFVLIDLKTSKITHQDVGQMDMYIRMYDELKKREDDNPTLGIVLCAETDEDIAKYSILNGNEQLFASKYKLYLPDEEELRHEIERQKAIFELQTNVNDSATKINE